MSASILQPLSNKLSNMALLCSFLVVFIHVGPECPEEKIFSWWCYHFIEDGICRIAVPFFFTAAGFFLAGHCSEHGWWQKECKKRISTLVIPYFAWSTVYALFSLTLILAANFCAGAEWSRNIPSWIHVYGFDLTLRPYLVPLWFVRELFIFILLSPLFVFLLTPSSKQGALFLCILYSLSYIPSLKIFNLIPIFYFCLGLWLRIWMPTFKVSKLRTISAFIIGFCATALFLYTEFTHLHGVWGIIPRAIAQPILLYATWNIVPANSWKKSLTSCAFPIFLIHCFILGLLNPIQKIMLSHIKMNECITYILYGILTILISILITITFRKYLPRLSAFLFGGR